MLNHIRAPEGSPVPDKYRKAIRNRATAIRAYCVDCQGGEVAEVRRCPSVTCPLHPFRMGRDPLRGYELPKPIIEPELPEEDDDLPAIEDEDDGD